jgi:CheY-like chemotaxis protein
VPNRPGWCPSVAFQARELPSSLGMSFRILLVDPDSLAAAASERVLVETGYRVVPVSTFEEATRQMSLHHPDLLVTKVRLGSFNGLHLLLRCRAEHPDVPVIIVGTSADRSADVTRFGAEFVTSPIEHDSLLELVASLLSGRTPSGPTSGQRGPRKRATLTAAACDRFAHGEPSCGDELSIEMDGAPRDTQVPADIGLRSLSDVTQRWRRATRRWRWTIDSLN